MKRRLSTSELETMTIWLTRDSIAAIRKLAQAEERSFGFVMRRLLAAALENENKR